MTNLDILRHGEPEGGRRYRGHGVDDPLSEKGWQQMWQAVPSTPPWQTIVTSPLARCRDFAEALATKLQVPCCIEDNLKEIGFGVWEGRTPADIEANDGDALQRFINDPLHNRPEGAEPLEPFAERVWEVYQRRMQQHQGQHILFVAHAGVIRAVTSRILGMPLDAVYSKLKIEYAAIARTRQSDKAGSSGPVLIL